MCQILETIVTFSCSVTTEADAIFIFDVKISQVALLSFLKEQYYIGSILQHNLVYSSTDPSRQKYIISGGAKLSGRVLNKTKRNICDCESRSVATLITAVSYH